MSEVQISTLHRKRGQVQGAITTFIKILDRWARNEEERDSDYLQISLETLQRAFDKFESIQDQLEELDETEGENRERIQTNHDRAVARARRYLREADTSNDQQGFRVLESQHSSTPSRNNSIPVTLPTITLPTFDGSVEGWTSFFDIFSAVIDKNPDLPPVRKLQYLRLSLRGSSARVIESLETTDSNYSVALSLLKNKYECTRRTLRRQWALLREYPRLQWDAPTGLSHLVDTFQQHIRALEMQGAPVDQWDIPLIDLILTKINASTIFQWELTLTSNDMPSYRNLLLFLEKRAKCTDFTTSSTDENLTKSKQQRQDSNRVRNSRTPLAQTYVTTRDDATPREKQCPICAQLHVIYRCDVFNAKSVDERQRAVARAGLCFNCLGHGHAIKACPSKRSCNKCKGRHHTLLHRATNNVTTDTPVIADTPRNQEEEPQA